MWPPAGGGGCTCGVELALLQPRLVQKQRGVGGQLQGAAQQTVRCIILPRDQTHLIHVLQTHGQVKRLRAEIEKEQMATYPPPRVV